MKNTIFDELKLELMKRGFSESLESPEGTIGLTGCSTSEELAELLEVMVARREKIFRSVEVVGQESAKKSYDDVVLVIDAAKTVIGRLRLG
ncbi:MAG TPA: hypothetical protein PKA88_24495 [Polyangiaceae bacterium]|nr:hypothetical protein [Polyangiaceae bacterium]HMR78796.1 hypothetical protein [Polyangiaceae bacterium]